MDIIVLGLEEVSRNLTKGSALYDRHVDTVVDKRARPLFRRLSRWEAGGGYRLLGSIRFSHVTQIRKHDSVCKSSQSSNCTYIEYELQNATDYMQVLMKPAHLYCQIHKYRSRDMNSFYDDLSHHSPSIL